MNVLYIYKMNYEFAEGMIYHLLQGEAHCITPCNLQIFLIFD